MSTVWYVLFQMSFVFVVQVAVNVERRVKFESTPITQQPRSYCEHLVLSSDACLLTSTSRLPPKMALH